MERAAGIAMTFSLMSGPRPPAARRPEFQTPLCAERSTVLWYLRYTAAPIRPAVALELRSRIETLPKAGLRCLSRHARQVELRSVHLGVEQSHRVWASAVAELDAVLEA